MTSPVMGDVAGHSRAQNLSPGAWGLLLHKTLCQPLESKISLKMAPVWLPRDHIWWRFDDNLSSILACGRCSFCQCCHFLWSLLMSKTVDVLAESDSSALRGLLDSPSWISKCGVRYPSSSPLWERQAQGVDSEQNDSFSREILVLDLLNSNSVVASRWVLDRA